jgi:hypothetical protein
MPKVEKPKPQKRKQEEVPEVSKMQPPNRSPFGATDKLALSVPPCF